MLILGPLVLQILTVPITGTGGQPPELSVTLPVAGTAIMSNSLYGRWTVEPFLDGASCGITRSFVLHQ